MMNDSCVTISNETTAIIVEMNKRLNLDNPPEKLDPKLERMLNEYSKQLYEIFKMYGDGFVQFDKNNSKIYADDVVQFHIDNFKNLVRKLYKKPTPSQNGGDDDEDDDEGEAGEKGEEVVPYKKNSMTYDFLAILSLLSSIFICYLAYIKFNNLISFIKDERDDDAGSFELFESFKSEFVAAIEKVKHDMEDIDSDLTFFQFMYKSFFTYSCKEQAQHLVTFIQKVINVAVINSSERIYSQVKEVCNLEPKVLQDDWGFVGKLVNGASSSISALVTSDTTSKCIIDVTNLQLQTDLMRSGHLLKMLTTKTLTTTNQITQMITIGTRIGIPAVMYLSYRLKELAKTVSGPKFPKLREYDETTNIFDRKNGGRKTKKNKNRKTKKNKNRKTKKNKNRKNKNTKQMSR